MKVLVTGGAGFIGSHLCEALLRNGHYVVAIDTFNDYYDPRIKHKNILSLQKNTSFQLYKADVRDKKAMSHIFNLHEPEVVVHLAARAGVRPSFEKKKLYEDVNLNGTKVLLELSKNCRQFVFGSSSSVYGANVKTPFSEEDEVNKQLSPYGETKRKGEALCREFAEKNKVATTCLRFFTVYGPRGRPDMAPYKFTESILRKEEISVFGEGTSKRDYTFISDIVSGILAALENEFDFEIINLGNSNPVPLLNFIKIIEKVSKKRAKLVFSPKQKGDMEITYADISKAQRLLDWTPKTGIEEGMQQFIQWYKGEKKWLSQL